jgi:hypothetical protein
MRPEHRGVACKPSMQPDDSGLAIESNVVRITSVSRRRKAVNPDVWESGESRGNARRTEATTKRLQQCSIAMDVGTWPVDGGQEALIQPE